MQKELDWNIRNYAMKLNYSCQIVKQLKCVMITLHCIPIINLNCRKLVSEATWLGVRSSHWTKPFLMGHSIQCIIFKCLSMSRCVSFNVCMWVSLRMFKVLSQRISTFWIVEGRFGDCFVPYALHWPKQN